MPVIRIPEKSWGKVWHFLLEIGPISRLSQDPIYLISARQLQLLRKKKMPHEVIPDFNGSTRRKKNAEKGPPL